MDSKTIRKRNLILFPLGTVGRDMIYNLVTSYLLTFVLFTRNLNAAQLSAITAIMVAARIFDALNDPVMGNIIERTRTRWGKFKPWLVIGILTTSVVIYATFNVKLQGWSFVWFFGVMYFLYSITYTMHDIAYWGMVPALSSDANTRNQLTSRATLFAGIGGVLAASLIPNFTAGDNALGGNAVTAYGLVALAVAILGPVFLAFTVFGVREQRNYLDEPAPPVSFQKIISTITGNDQLLWISLIFLLQQIGNGVVMSGIGQTYIYVEFGYKGIFFTAFGAFAMYGYCELFNPEFVSGYNAYEIIHTGEECTWIQGGSWFYCHAANMYSTYYMNMAIFLAFAATYPETTVLLMFIIPVKMKVLGIFDALYMIYLAFELSIGETPFGLFVIGASLLNFLVFFVLTRKGMRRSPQMRKRQKEFKRKMREIRYERDDRRIAKHKCAICGRTSEDYPNMEFRFCSKCEGNYEFCEDHLFTHKHFKRSDMSNSTNNDKDVMGGSTPNGDKL